MAIRAYLNPSIIENFDNVANNNLFLKKENTAFGFSEFVYNKTILPLTGNIWNINNTSETFTYGDVSANTTISVVCSSQSEKEGIEHVLRINNTDDEAHTITISCDNAYMLSPHASNSNQQSVYTVPANTNVEFRALLYHIDAVNIINLTTNSNYLTASDIINILGYTPYNGATNPNNYITEEDYLQSDWDVTDVLSKAFIANKPTNVSAFANDAGYITSSDIPPIPTIPTNVSAFINDVGYVAASNLATINDLPLYNGGNIQITGGGGETTSYIGLTDLPTLNSVTISGDHDSAYYSVADAVHTHAYTDITGLAAVASSGDYSDLLNTPTIPTIPVNVSYFNNDAGYITSAAISGKRDIYTPVNDGVYAYTATKSSGTTTQGALSVLSAIDSSNNLVKSSAIKTALDLKSDIASTVTLVSYDSTNKIIQYTKAGVVYDVVSIATIAEDLNIPDPQIQSDWEQDDNTEPDYIKNKPTFATVATSGDYDDLLNKPVIPTALPSYTVSNSDNILAVNHDGNAVEWVVNPGETNVQSDWNEADPADDAYILNKPEIKEYNDYLTFEFTGSTTLKLTKTGSPGDLSLEYSTNMKDWTTWVETAGVRSLNVTSGTKYYFRGNNQNVSGFSTSSYYTFSLAVGATAEVYCSGNIMSIVDASCKQTVMRNKSYRFANLFKNFSNLKSAPDIKITDITGSTGIFHSMFYSTGIKTPPVMYLTVMANSCCHSMFRECNDLLKTADIYVTAAEPYCCAYMYYLCSSLKDAGKIRFTSMSTQCCYSMFESDTSLTKGADILATSAATMCCGRMYSGCTQMQIPPKINFTSLATGCCDSMFVGDTALLRTPLIKGLLNVDGAYNNAFFNCSNLKEVQITSDIWDTVNMGICTNDWLYGVSATGIFYCDEDLPETFDSSHIPSGWTVVHVEDTSIEHFDFANEDRCGIVRTSAEYDEDVHTTEIAINPVDGKLYSETKQDEIFVAIYDMNNPSLSTHRSAIVNAYMEKKVIMLWVKSYIDDADGGMLIAGDEYIPLTYIELELYNGEVVGYGDIIFQGVPGRYYEIIANNSYTCLRFILNSESNWTISTFKILPSEGTNSGKFLTTNGTQASWEAITQYASPYKGQIDIPAGNLADGEYISQIILYNYPEPSTYIPTQEKHFFVTFGTNCINNTTWNSTAKTGHPYTIPIVGQNSGTGLSDSYGIRHRLYIENGTHNTSNTLYIQLSDITSGITDMWVNGSVSTTKNAIIAISPNISKTGGYDHSYAVVDIIYYAGKVIVEQKDSTYYKLLQG